MDKPTNEEISKQLNKFQKLQTELFQSTALFEPYFYAMAKQIHLNAVSALLVFDQIHKLGDKADLRNLELRTAQYWEEKGASGLKASRPWVLVNDKMEWEYFYNRKDVVNAPGPEMSPIGEDEFEKAFCGSAITPHIKARRGRYVEANGDKCFLYGRDARVLYIGYSQSIEIVNPVGPQFPYEFLRETWHFQQHLTNPTRLYNRMPGNLEATIFAYILCNSLIWEDPKFEAASFPDQATYKRYKDMKPLAALTDIDRIRRNACTFREEFLKKLKPLQMVKLTQKLYNRRGR